MRINIILILFVIILGLLFSIKDTRRNRLYYILLCNLILIFVAAMRSPEWMTYTYGIDTLNYKYLFENSLSMGWDELKIAASQRYFGSAGEESDVGYYFLNKIVGLFTKDFHIFSLLADLIFFVPFGIMLYRYSTKIGQLIFAFVFYISLLQIYFIGGGRQTFAIGFDLMAFLSLLNNKKVRSAIFVVLAVSIHFSSLLFIIPLLLINFKASPKIIKSFHIICFLVFPFIWLNPNSVIVFMGNAVGVEKYATYGTRAIQGGAQTFIVLIELLSLFCFAAIKTKDMIRDRVIYAFYVMAPFFTLLSPLIRSNGSMIRISLYFFVFLTLLMPFAIDCLLPIRSRKVAYAVAIVSLSILAIANGGMEYYFFWQR